jgi:hypothetical protein
MRALRDFLRPIRLGAAMGLVCAICLPLSQCSQGGNNAPPPANPALLAQFFPQTSKNATVEYAIGELGFSWKGICTLLAFTWPLLWLRAGRKLMESRFAWIFYFLEVVLCAGTAYMLMVLTFGGDLLWGGYAAVISTGLFACTALVFLGFSLWVLCRKIRDKIRGAGGRRQAMAGAPGG